MNLEKLHPCAGEGHIPLCQLLPLDGDGFLKGKAIIEETDVGNNFNIFGANVATYGFVVQGCPKLNAANGCLSRSYQTILACYLPRRCLPSYTKVDCDYN